MDYNDQLVERIQNGASDIEGLYLCIYDNHFDHGETYDSCHRSHILSYGRPYVQCDDIGPNSKGESAFLDVQDKDFYNRSPHPTDCIYDRSKIDNIAQSENAIRLFGENNSITRAFCGSKTTTCPPNMSSCSRYFSIAEDGGYCRDKFNNMTDAQRDSVMREYCLRNDTEDCRCVNRTLNKDYLALKQNNPFSDACWYIPCANKARYFVPSHFLGPKVDCPSNICQIVYDISKVHDVDLERNKNYINCDFSGGGYVPPFGEIWFYVVGLLLAVLFLSVYAAKK